MRGEHLLGSLRDGRLAVTSELISGLLHLLDGLRAILVLIEETGSEGTRSTDEDGELIAELALLNGAMPPAEIEAEMLHAVVNVGEDVIGPVDAATAALKASNVAAVQGWTATNNERAGAANDKTLRIDVDVLNRMMNLVGELVLTRNQMLQSDMASANFPELARRLDSVTADLRETVMQARMQPVGNLFGKFPRMVRDLARTCGREVRIEFTGQETGLDKSLLEAITDTRGEKCSGSRHRSAQRARVGWQIGGGLCSSEGVSSERIGCDRSCGRWRGNSDGAGAGESS